MSAGVQDHLTDAELNDLADGELDAPTRARLEAHLASCAQCDAAMRELRSLASWTATHRAAVTAPPELWPLVAASTIHLRTVRRQVLRSMRGPLLVGALALVAATAAVTWRLAHLSWSSGDGDRPAATAPAQRSGLGPGQHAGHPTTTRSPRRGPGPPGAADPAGAGAAAEAVISPRERGGARMNKEEQESSFIVKRQPRDTSG